MRRFIKTVVPKEGYEQVTKVGGVWIIHLEPVENEADNSITCYECTTDSEPDLTTLESELAEWKEYVKERESEVLIRQRMSEIKSELSQLDYLTSKYVDGEDMTEYGDWQGHRKALREEYRQLEEQLNG